MMTSAATAHLVRRAARADLDFVAWCNHTATSPEPGFCYWDPLLAQTGTPAMDFIRAVFTQRALAWGDVEDFFLVEANGRLLGGGSAFVMDPNDYRPLRLARLPAVAQALGWSEASLTGFVHGYEAVWPDPLDPSLSPQAEWIIECVAVVDDARGQGVAGRLLDGIAAAARAQGVGSLGISITNGNLPAQRAYEKFGFAQVAYYGPDLYGGAYPGSTKYRYAVTPSQP